MKKRFTKTDEAQFNARVHNSYKIGAKTVTSMCGLTMEQFTETILAFVLALDDKDRFVSRRIKEIRAAANRLELSTKLPSLEKLERAKGFEPSTFTLATCRSIVNEIVKAGVSVVADGSGLKFVFTGDNILNAKALQSGRCVPDSTNNSTISVSGHQVSSSAVQDSRRVLRHLQCH